MCPGVDYVSGAAVGPADSGQLLLQLRTSTAWDKHRTERLSPPETIVIIKFNK